MARTVLVFDTGVKHPFVARVFAFLLDGERSFVERSRTPVRSPRSPPWPPRLVTATAARDPAAAAPAASRRRGAPRRHPPTAGRGRRRAPRRDRRGRPRGRPGLDGARGHLPAVPGHRPGAASYVVQPGDTLWSIARSLQPDGDVRPLVRGLSAANGGAVLAVGQVLVLP